MKALTLALLTLTAQADWSDRLGLNYDITARDLPGWKIQLGKDRWGTEDKVHFTLAEDFKLDDKCTLRKGGRLKFNWSSFNRPLKEGEPADPEVPFAMEPIYSKLEAEYDSPLMIVWGCATGKKTITRQQFVEMFSAVSPDYKRNHALREEGLENQRARKAKVPINLNAGDEIWVDATSRQHPESVKVKSVRSSSGAEAEGECYYPGGLAKVVKVPAQAEGKYVLEHVREADHYTKDQRADHCKAATHFEVSADQLGGWFRQRLSSAKPVRVGSKCYRETTYASPYSCLREKGERELMNKRLEPFCAIAKRNSSLLRENPQEWLRQARGKTNYELSEMIPDLVRMAHLHLVPFTAVKECAAPVDAQAEYEKCLKLVETRCPRATTEEGRRMESILHPERDEQFIRQIQRGNEERQRTQETGTGTLE